VDSIQVSARLLGRLLRIGERILGVVFFIAILFFLLRHHRELEALRHLRLVAPGWLAVALLAQILVLLAIARQLQILAHLFGYRVPLARLLRADLHRVAISTVTPAGAAVGAAVFARDLEPHGVPLDTGLTITLLYGVIGFLSFVLLLPVSLLSAVTLSSSIRGDLWSLLPNPHMLGALAIALAVLPMGLLVWGRRRRALPRPLRVLLTVDKRKLLPVLLLALTVDLFNVVLLFAAFSALGRPLPLPEVLIGYQVAYLFAFIVPFAQGSGAVELAGVAAFRAFGVPPPIAVAAVLLWRAYELWFPFTLGSLLWLQREPLIRRGFGRLPALLLLWSGFVSIFGLLEPQRHRVLVRGLERVGLLEPWEVSRNLELLLGFLSIVIAFHLWRWKRAGWLAAVGLLLVSVTQQVVGRRDPVVLTLSLLALVLLVLNWREFRVRSDTPTVLRGFGTAVAGLVVAVSYGAIGLVILSRHALAPGPLSWEKATQLLVASGFGFGNWEVVPLSRYGAWFLDSIPLIIGGALLNAAWSLGQPVVWRAITHERERQRARSIIERCGNSSLDFFKWWPDKWFYFLREGDGVVAYLVYGRVALVLGDPNACSQHEFHQLLDEFLDVCALNDWEPAFHQVTEAYLDSYRKRGLRWLKIGEEAIVDLGNWSLHRPGFKDFRYLVRRFQREGYVFELVQPPLSQALLDELEAVSKEWLTVLGRRERFSTQGQFSKAYLRNTPVALLRHPRIGVVAFANLVPSGVPGEATIDLMRRRHEPYGAMDVLLVHLLEWCREHGYQRFSLGLAPVAGVKIPGLATDSLRQRFYSLLDGFFSVEGLRHYKAKFQPHWEPRFLVYRSTVALPAIGLALLRATAGSTAGSTGGEPLPSTSEAMSQ